ncbi:MAG: DUF469 family protein [Burkholderiales bacterium]|nr:DUF469 family protein [Burkholderiales bacterium]
MTKNKCTRKYNQRQRKKMRVGEYQELVFVVTANPAEAFSAEQREAWMDEFVEHAIEGNGVVCAAAFNDDLWCYVMGEEKRASVTEAQRLAVLEWLSKKTEIVNLQVSPLRDANLGIELESA